MIEAETRARWLKVSVVGLLVSSAAWGIGEVTLVRLHGFHDPLSIIGRLVAAALRGGGTGFTLLFALTLVAGLLHWMLHGK